MVVLISGTSLLSIQTSQLSINLLTTTLIEGGGLKLNKMDTCDFPYFAFRHCELSQPLPLPDLKKKSKSIGVAESDYIFRAQAEGYNLAGYSFYPLLTLFSYSKTSIKKGHTFDFY